MNETYPIPYRYLALIAHDNKKKDMLKLVARHRDLMTNWPLLATGTTGQLIQERFGIPVKRMLSGPYGGDQQIGSKIACNKVAAVIFLRDPLTAHPHEPDITAILRLCDVHNVPVATNLASAEVVLAAIRASLAEISPAQEKRA